MTQDIKLKPTPEQEAFCQALWSGTPCFLSARAGTGKTSTIKLALDRAPSKLDCTVIAFNKQNQQDLAQALGINARVATLHSLGFSALRQYMPGLILDVGKLFELTKQARIKGQNTRRRFADTMRLVSCAKNWGIIPARPSGKPKTFKQGLIADTPENWILLQDHFELWEADLEAARTILQQSNEAFWTEKKIDFDDMVYLPVALGLQVFTSSKMIVDEAQDLSPLNLKMLSRTPAKIWYVGDPYQAIYGWRGSEEDTISKLDLPELPLTTCWRCDSAIIKEAQKYVPDIKARLDASLGTVAYFTKLPDWTAEEPAVILSRHNAALVNIAMKLLAQKKSVYILGKELIKTLTAVLEEFKGTTQIKLLAETESWMNKMQDKYPHKAGEFRDYASCLKTLIQNHHGIPAILRTINSLFTDEPQPNTWLLSTIHKAKGREWSKVWLLDWTAKQSAQPWMKKEERNLKYVAVTRAKHFLGIIAESAWQEVPAQEKDWRQI